MDTSGLLLEEIADGSIRVGYVDYCVDFFGGRDFESFYTLDKENADKLRAYLLGRGYPNFQSGLTDIVGEKFSDKKFRDLCAVAGVEYSHTTRS